MDDDEKPEVYILLLENKKAAEGNTEYFKLKPDTPHPLPPKKTPKTNHKKPWTCKLETHLWTLDFIHCA